MNVNRSQIFEIYMANIWYVIQRVKSEVNLQGAPWFVIILCREERTKFFLSILDFSIQTRFSRKRSILQKNCIPRFSLNFASRVTSSELFFSPSRLKLAKFNYTRSIFKLDFRETKASMNKFYIFLLNQSVFHMWDTLYFSRALIFANLLIFKDSLS